MIKKGILQGWGKVVNSLFLDDYKINGVSNHYDKLETTETIQLTMDNGQWTIGNRQVPFNQYISKVRINIFVVN
jgi:hypothetical protein